MIRKPRETLPLSRVVAACLFCLSVAAQKRPQPSIEFTVVPASAGGNGIRVDMIEGRVKGVVEGERIVLFARSAESWWVQPVASKPFTEIGRDSRWKGLTHPGTAYAALLVDPRYVPPSKVEKLPEAGGMVLAVATTTGPPALPSKTIEFSGYPWKVRDGGRQQSGQISFYDADNAWTDPSGFLHLRITKHDEKWMCAEITLSRSLGYGSYRFVVRDASRLEPAAVFIVGPSAKMAIELSRWGRPEDRNAQYVITPYDVPANTLRFTAPGGTVTHWMNWEPDRVTFRTTGGSSSKIPPVAEHAFTSGVRAPGNERISLNLYVLDSARSPVKHTSEVIVEKFEFLP